jgi:predicted  nucleic acid-binding Zn-ribbon protein
MTTVLPKRHEAQQLCRLRALRVQRAREGVAKAQEEVRRVEESIRQRQRDVETVRRAVDDLQNAMVTTLVPALPRWSHVAGAQRERLADRLERAEYALVQAERELEGAQEALQAARAELTRALAREDTVRDLAKQTRRAFAAQREQLAERDLEDLGRGAQDRAG